MTAQDVVSFNPAAAGDESVRQLADACRPLLELQGDKATIHDALVRDAGTLFDAGPAAHLVVAFCTTCLKRDWQSKLALPWNILALWPFRRRAHLFLGDFSAAVAGGGQSPLTAWMVEALAPAIDEGLLRPLRSTGLPGWHASIAKNAVAFCAVHDLLAEGYDADNIVVFNLDCDRVMGADLPRDVLAAFAQAPNDVHQWSSNWQPGSYGMIACTARQFVSCNGYDESLLPSGCQDTDLMLRLGKMGCARRNRAARRVIGFGIDNDTADPAEHNHRADLIAKVANVTDPRYASMKWGHMDAANRAAMHANLRAERLVANTAADWGPLPMQRLAAAGGGQSPLPPRPSHPQAVRLRPAAPATPPPLTVHLIAFGVRRLWAELGKSELLLRWREFAEHDVRRLEEGQVRAAWEQVAALVVLVVVGGGGAVGGRRRWWAVVVVVVVVRQGGRRADLFLNCACYDDPDRDRSLAAHVGWHPQIIAGLLKPNQVGHTERLFSRVKALLQMAPPGSTLTVAVFCRSGVHRSGAMTILLEKLLLAEGMRVPPPIYWSRWWWEHHKCQPKCGICSDEESRREALEEARAVRAPQPLSAPTPRHPPPTGDTHSAATTRALVTCCVRQRAARTRCARALRARCARATSTCFVPTTLSSSQPRWTRTLAAPGGRRD